MDKETDVCEFCGGTGKIEKTDYETGYGTGYYKKCFNCADDDTDSQGVKE